MHLILKFTVLEGLLSPHFRIVPKGTIVWPQPQPSTFPNLNSPREAQDAFGGDVARILKDKQRAGPRVLS